jgi:hypothetical protein
MIGPRKRPNDAEKLGHMDSSRLGSPLLERVLYPIVICFDRGSNHRTRLTPESVVFVPDLGRRSLPGALPRRRLTPESAFLVPGPSLAGPAPNREHHHPRISGSTSILDGTKPSRVVMHTIMVTNSRHWQPSLHLSTPHTAITLYFRRLTLSLNCRINLKMQVLMLAAAQRDFGKTTTLHS